MNLTVLVTAILVYLALGVVISRQIRRRLKDADLPRDVVKRFAVLTVFTWPATFMIGLAGNFPVGRRVLGRLFDVDPAEIEPRQS